MRMKKSKIPLLAISLTLFFVNFCFAESNLFLLSQQISLELYPKEYTQTGVLILNSGNTTCVVNSKITGNVQDFVTIENPELILELGEGMINISIYIAPETTPGPYYGTIVIESENFTSSVPVNIRVLQPREKILDINVVPITDVISPGQTLRVDTTLYNLAGSGKIDAQLIIQLIDPSTNEPILEKTENVTIETTTSLIIEMDIPEDILEGRYIIRGTADFICEGAKCKETAISYVTVRRSFNEFTLYGIPLWLLFIAVPVFIVLSVLVILLVIIYFVFIKKKKE